MRALRRALVALTILVAVALQPGQADAQTQTYHSYIQGKTGVFEITFDDYGSVTNITVGFFRDGDFAYQGVVGVFGFYDTMVYPYNYVTQGALRSSPASIILCWWIPSDRWGVIPWVDNSDQGWAQFDTYTGGIYPTGYSYANFQLIGRDWVYGPGGKPCGRILMY